MYSWTYYCNFYELKLSSNTQMVVKLLWPDFFQESNLVLCSKKRCLEKQQNSHDLLGSCRQTSLNLYVPPLTFHYTQTRAVTSHPLRDKPFSQPHGWENNCMLLYICIYYMFTSHRAFSHVSLCTKSKVTATSPYQPVAGKLS